MELNGSIKDGLNFMRKVTLRRAWNALKVLFSFYYSKWTGKPTQWGVPISVSFEPTTSCNLRCPECPSGLREFTRPTGMLDNGFFRDTVEQLKNDLLYLIFYFQGEPYLNPDFLDMVRYASDRGIYTATSTNAHYLKDENAKRTVESGLDRMIISIDGTTQETYENYRIGGNLEKVIEGAKNVVKWKKELNSKTPHVIFQFLVVKPNEHQLEDVKKLGAEVGVDEVRFKTAQIYDYENDPNNLIPDNPKYSRYNKSADGQASLKNPLLNHCWKLWHSCVLTWDGLVVPCCFDKDATHQLGDLKKNSFDEIWQGEKYQDFRTSLFKSRSEIDICANCTEGTKVWA
ncbi:SPASM domain-containing protein [Flavobacteriales bacterium]|nr:SPASM domain-containing protein [Flavobacteriales bacterium]